MKRLLSLCCMLFSSTLLAQTPEANLKKLNLVLPPVSAPMANYVRAVQTGNLVFLAGHGPTRADGSSITGKVGADLTVEEGYEAVSYTHLTLPTNYSV